MVCLLVTRKSDTDLFEGLDQESANVKDIEVLKFAGGSDELDDVNEDGNGSSAAILPAFPLSADDKPTKANAKILGKWFRACLSTLSR